MIVAQKRLIAQESIGINKFLGSEFNNSWKGIWIGLSTYKTKGLCVISYDTYSVGYIHFEFNCDYIKVISTANNHPKIKFYWLDNHTTFCSDL